MAFNKLTLEQKIAAKVERVGECLIWRGQRSPRGYGFLRLAGRLQRAHRIVYEMRHGPIPANQVVRHKCDTPACVEIEHLILGTQLDNVQDMFERGRANKAKGERCSHAKLTQAQVDEIRARYRPRSYGHGAHSLAKEFGVSKQSVQAILKRESWA